MKKDVSKETKSSGLKTTSLFTKKRIIIILASVVLVFAVLLASVIFKKDEVVIDSIYYYPASESENIFENKAYLSFERNLRYSCLGIEELYEYEKDYEGADQYCKFFLDYFKTAIAGDGEKLQGFYVDGYFKTTPDITMQMIYEPYVLYHSESKLDDNGEEISVANFEVRYKIFKNNGTFRKGVESNVAVPQVYQLTKKNGELKILNILEIAVEDEN